MGKALSSHSEREGEASTAFLPEGRPPMWVAGVSPIKRYFLVDLKELSLYHQSNGLSVV